MTEVFLKILNMSIAAGWLVPVVLLARLLFKKAPKWINVLLWGLVGLRLCLPFSFESIFSLVPSGETVSPAIMLDPTPEIHSGISAVNSVVNPVISESFSPMPGSSMNPLQLWVPLCAVIWCVGVFAMVAYAAVSFAVLKRRVRTSFEKEKGIFLGDKVFSPFVLGLFRPKIYVPANVGDDALLHICAHENAHIKRKDHLWKPLGWLILSVHWFNP
ncbi:MAG: transcriptional regulator, partial [Oscillospiraceae bacterium]|nr:transcriptional regulator [Oscillospiraceae bacterium]